MTRSRQEDTPEDPDSLAALIAEETDETLEELENGEFELSAPWESDREIVE